MIPLMKNAFLSEKETKAALAKFIIETNKLSMDIQCKKFEEEFSEYQQSENSVLFNSGGSANLAILQTLKNLGRLKDGDQVGFSALTWSTNVMPIIQLGLVPVAIDCSIKTLNVMSENLLDRLNETTLKALFITNALGFAGDLDKITDICAEKNIILIEDNCESLGTELAGKKTGNFGVMSSFSFFVAHHMSTIEGGMVCTNDPDCYEMLQIVRANGWDRNLTAAQQHKWREKFKIRSEFDAKYTFYDLGYNLRPTEITGFIGRFQLGFLKDNIEKRQKNYFQLEAIAEKNSDFLRIDRSHITTLSNFSFPVLCKSPEIRSGYLSQFSGAGVEIRPMIAGNIQNQPFYKKYVKNLYKLPDTEIIHTSGFYFGNYPELSFTDLETLSSCLIKYQES